MTTRNKAKIILNALDRYTSVIIIQNLEKAWLCAIEEAIRNVETAEKEEFTDETST